MKKTRIEGLVLSFESDGKLLARGAAHAKAARVPPMAVAVLSFCGLPRQREEVVQQFGAAGGALFDGLCDAGLLANPEEAASTPVFFQNFASLDIHRRMLADQRRLDVYRSAIEEVLKPGMWSSTQAVEAASSLAWPLAQEQHGYLQSTTRIF